MATATLTKYEAIAYDLTGLVGLSDEQIAQHKTLYAGYVNNTNKLNDELARLVAEGKADGLDPSFAELKRRLGFEYNGMRLHEYYFSNLKADGGDLPLDGALARALEASFGSVENWKKDFMAVCKMRGVGWAILCQDPLTGKLQNNWVTLHEEGNFVGFSPILVIDIWEHAFTVDYKPTERAKYLEAVFKNIHWAKVESRLLGEEVAAATRAAVTL
ncbi:MAG: Fe-Mn family superoxide dismutase [bacterium]|nr:Fe-Mn family superoxide dismutase [bacterium]